MIDCVIKDRSMIVQAVLDGILSVDYITEKDLFKLENNIFEAICNKHTPFAIWDTVQ